MSLFSDGMDHANDAFAGVAAETFEVVRGGTAGTYSATSIDDLSASTAVMPGGQRAENNVLVFISQVVLDASAIRESAVLIVRNKRVRVVQITYDGDNTPQLVCASAGVKL